jgi:hypothetical protein
MSQACVCQGVQSQKGGMCVCVCVCSFFLSSLLPLLSVVSVSFLPPSSTGFAVSDWESLNGPGLNNGEVLSVAWAPFGGFVYAGLQVSRRPCCVHPTMHTHTNLSHTNSSHINPSHTNASHITEDCVYYLIAVLCLCFLLVFMCVGGLWCEDFFRTMV